MHLSRRGMHVWKRRCQSTNTNASLNNKVQRVCKQKTMQTQQMQTMKKRENEKILPVLDFPRLSCSRKSSFCRLIASAAVTGLCSTLTFVSVVCIRCISHHISVCRTFKAYDFMFCSAFLFHLHHNPLFVSRLY